MPKVILTLHRTGGKPHGVVLNTSRQANDAAVALVRGFLLADGHEIEGEAFLLLNGTTRISWTNSARSHHVTVERL